MCLIEDWINTEEVKKSCYKISKVIRLESQGIDVNKDSYTNKNYDSEYSNERIKEKVYWVTNTYISVD